jgi:hypothetical protein
MLQTIGTCIGVIGAMFTAYNTYTLYIDKKLHANFSIIATWPWMYVFLELDDFDEEKKNATEETLVKGKLELEKAFIGFKITNLSRFPIWVEDAGFAPEKTLRWKSQAHRYISIERNLQTAALPFRLEQRESRIYHSNVLLTTLKHNDKAIYAYIKTACGEMRFKNIRDPLSVIHMASPEKVESPPPCSI